MKSNYFYHAIALSLAISCSFTQTSEKRTVQFDLSNLGEQLGGASSNTTQSIVTGIMQGFAAATQNPNFGNAIGDIFKNLFRDVSGGLADAVNDKEFQNNIKETTNASSKLIGNTAKEILRETSDELANAINDKEFQDNIKKTTSALGSVEFLT